MKNLLFIIFLLDSLLINAQKTYYVGEGGNNNTGDGSYNKPWATLAYACSKVTIPRDTISIKEGTINETSQSILSVGVNVKGAGNSSIIKSMINTNENSATIKLNSDLEGTDGNQSISNLKLDGNNLTANVAIEIRGRSNVKIFNIVVLNFKYQGVVFNGATSDGEPTYATNNEFYNSTIRNCATYSGWGRGNLVIGGQEGFKCYNNTIDQPDRGLGKEGWCIKGGYDSGWNKGTKIFNCILLKAPFDGASFDFALEFLYNDQGGLEIYDNVIQGAIDLGARHKGDYEYSAYIHNNIIGKSERNSIAESGIMIENKAENLIIKYNYFYNLSHGIWLHFGSSNVGDVQPDYLRDIYIQYNIFDKMGSLTQSYQSKGIELQSGKDNGGIAERWYIDNNVFTAYNGSAGNVGIYLSNSHSLKNIYVRNNIFKDFSISYINANGTFGANVNGLYLQNNLFYNNGNNNNPLWEGGYSITNLVEENNKKENPYFVNESAINFQLQSISSGIDAGINVGLTRDYRNYTVPFNSKPDIGAYEYGSSPVTEIVVPVVLTSDVTSISTSAALSGGFVNNDGGGILSVRGVCWGESPNPTILNNKTTDGSSTGSFQSIITQLSSNTTYFLRAYATNEKGTGYGSEIEFRTLTSNQSSNTIEFTIYPNPASDYFNIVIPEDPIYKTLLIKIIDFSGKIIQEIPILSNFKVVSTIYFLPGIYTLQLVNNNIILDSEKLIISSK